MKLTTAQLREWLDAHYRDEITYGKVVQNINEFFNPPTIPNEPQRLTAEETLSKEMDWPGWIPLTSPVVPTEKVMIAMEAFSRQEVEVKDREWRERISEEITVLQGGNEKLPEESAARMCNDWAIWKLENLLKQEG